MNTTASETDTDRQAPSTEGPGRRLRALRESMDLELSRVAVLLHLSEEKLVALEADDYGKLPGPVFVQGYLRNYARLLEVPVEPVLKAYRAASPESAVMPELRITQVSHEVRSGHALVRLVTWGIVVGLILLSVVWWRGYLRWPMQAPQTLESETAAPTEPSEREGEENDTDQKFPVVEVNEDGAVTLALPQDVSLEPPAPASEPIPEAADTAAGGSEPDTGRAAAGDESAEQINPPASAAVTAQPTVPAVTTSGQVVLEFIGTSWTKIEDAGGSFRLEGSNSAGTRRVLQGVPPYRMVLGNASAVRITVNGREFDLTPYSRGNVARFSLDPESLSR